METYTKSEDGFLVISTTVEEKKRVSELVKNREDMIRLREQHVSSIADIDAHIPILDARIDAAQKLEVA